MLPRPLMEVFANDACDKKFKTLRWHVFYGQYISHLSTFNSLSTEITEYYRIHYDNMYISIYLFIILMDA